MHRFTGLLLLVLLTTAPLHAATYHVSPSGSDSTSCAAAQSASIPRRSINAGIACLSGGDTLIVGAGSYDEAIYDWAGAYAGGTTSPVPSGRSASQPTTIQAAPGASVWLRPSMVHPGGGAQIEFINARHVVIDGVNVNLGGMTAYIVAAGKDTSHLIFQNMELTNSRHCGVQAYGEGLRFVNLHVHHNAFGAAASQYGQSCHGFYVAGSNGLYDRLTVHDHDGYGLQFSCDGCGGAGGGNVVSNSAFFNNKQGGVMAGGSNNRVLNTLLYNNGIGLITSSAAIHNTLYGNRQGGILVGGSPEIRDNIVIDDGTIASHYDGGSAGGARNNLCNGGGFGCALTGTAASVFVNAGGGDFHIPATSPAYRTASDGTDVGVNFGQLGAAPAPAAPAPPPLPAPRNVRVIPLP